MKKFLVASIIAMVIALAWGPFVNAQMAKEGSGTSVSCYTGTYEYLAMGQKYFHMTYETRGVTRADAGEGPLHNASSHCLGAMHAVNGAFKDSAFCVFDCANGEKVYMTFEGEGMLGGTSQANYTLVGGTGEYEGIEGSGEFSRYPVGSSANGTFQGYNLGKGSWKLP